MCVCVRQRTGSEKIAHTLAQDRTSESSFYSANEKRSPSQTKQAMTAGQRGTYTISFYSTHRACTVCACGLSRHTATFFLNHTHTLRYSFSHVQHVFQSGWHMYMQSFSLACSGSTEGKRESRRGGGRKKKRKTCM